MRVAIDIETYPFDCGAQLPTPVCLSYCFDGGVPGIVIGDDIATFTSRVLKHCDEIVGHNIAFDLGSIVTHWPSLEDLVFRTYESNKVLDTMIWCQLADYAVGRNARQYGLGPCCDRFQIEHGDKESEWRTRYHELDGLPVTWWPEEARRYSLLDASSTLALSRALRVVPDVAAQSRYAYWLRLSAAYGLMTDAPRVEEWGRIKTSRANELRKGLEAAGLIRDNGTRNMLAIRTAVDRAYDGSPPRTPGDRPATDGVTCRDSGDPVLTTYAEYTECLASITKDLPRLRHPYVHTRYDLAETGRTTSSGGKSPYAMNLQNLNLRSGARRCFRPRDGHVYCIADYGKLELCCLGQLCNALGTGDDMAAAIRAGIDPHAVMAASILGVDFANVKSHPEFKAARQSAKIVNFGLPGGMGPKSLVEYAWALYHVRITEPDAVRLRDLWRRQWPDIVRYQRYVGKLIEAHCEKCGVPALDPEDSTCVECGATILNGTLDHYRSGRLRGGLSYTQGCNTLFQGLGADVTKAAGWALTRAGYSIVAFVHDEYLIELPADNAVDMAADVARILADVARDWLPSAPSTAEPCLATRWIKDDPAYDERGRLTVIDVDSRDSAAA